MLSSKEDFLDKIIGFLGDVGRETLDSIISDDVDKALANERNREIKRAARALYEVKVEEEVIIQMLHNYWKINENEAKEALRVEKTVYSPKRLLITYLQGQGYKPSYVREFIESKDVEKKLENNPTLWKLSNSPEELIEAIEES